MLAPIAALARRVPPPLASGSANDNPVMSASAPNDSTARVAVVPPTVPATTVEGRGTRVTEFVAPTKAVEAAEHDASLNTPQPISSGDETKWCNSSPSGRTSGQTAFCASSASKRSQVCSQSACSLVHARSTVRKVNDTRVSSISGMPCCKCHRLRPLKKYKDRLGKRMRRGGRVIPPSKARNCNSQALKRLKPAMVPIWQAWLSWWKLMLDREAAS
mmetsp:Transcript_84856/g.274279  ORF Transcript_84856/g.274279 Transcript_84856/m.274279 type:complete len:217 (-) Transcript_84856:771-1421(-)